MTARPKASRAGRRSGDSGTSEAILEAAREQFASRGYQGATIRGIAAVAGVDPALVHHFYGTKEALFAAAMRLPVVLSEVITAALTTPGETGANMVRSALTLWESDGVKETLLGLLRSAVNSERAAVMLAEFLAESVLAPIARAAGLDQLGSKAEVEYRVSMVATQMVGLALTRLVLALPAVAGASVDQLAATIGPSIERYLIGDIALYERPQPPG
jgi:AcrR family transcriptional regulator